MSIFFLQIYCAERRMMMWRKFGKGLEAKISKEWKKTQENKNISNVETKDDGQYYLLMKCP